MMAIPQYKQRKHFNKIRSQQAAVLPPVNIFTISSRWNTVSITHQDLELGFNSVPYYRYHQTRQDQAYESKTKLSKIKAIHNEVCGCNKFAICRLDTGRFSSRNIKVGQHNHHDICFSHSYKIQCKQHELLEFHLAMLSEWSFMFRKEKEI